MKPYPLSYAELEAAVLDWAIPNPGLQLALLAGSRARRQPPADEWSDLDLILFFKDLSPRAGQRAWLEAFGEIELAYRDTTGAGDVEWLVLYVSGLKADFMLARFPPHLQNPAERQEYLLHGPLSEVLPFGGRNLAGWADALALEALPATFGLYDTADLWRALQASMHLFQRLAQECGHRLGYPYPKGLGGRIWEQVLSIQALNPNQQRGSRAP
jgi:hypothetical protein